MASSRQPSRARRDAAVYHIVPHTHWDREWYKPFEVFRARLVQCIDEVIAILDRDPSFTSFMLDGQASVIDDYLEMRPERAADLKRLISSGRLGTGPWYTLPDEFLVSGEALVRNLMMGSARARAFGHSMQVGYVPDSFGHSASMPAIFRGFGLTHAVAWRGFGGEPGQDTSEWMWRSPDGSMVLLHHLHKDGYSAATFDGLSPREAAARFATLRARIDARATTPHRLLLSGGDHHFPDAALPRIVRALRGTTGADIRLSTLEKFFDGIDAASPALNIIDGELHFGYRYAFVVSSGVYSSRVTLKQSNWRVQRLFERYAEPLQAIAGMGGTGTDHALLQHGWKMLLQNHAHDSICGCSVDAVHDEMATRFAKTEQVGRVLVQNALDRILPARVRASKDDRQIIVFNPSPTTRSDIAACAVESHLQDIVVGLNPDVRPAPRSKAPRGFAVSDSRGRSVRHQIIARREAYGLAESRLDYSRQSIVDRTELLIDARALPGLSITPFSLERTASAPRFASQLRVRGTTMENAFVAVRVRSNGSLTLRDKHTGLSYDGLLIYEDGADVGDEYSYSPPKNDRVITSNDGRATARVSERGPLRAAIDTEITLNIPVEAASDRTRRARAVRPMRISTKIVLYEHSPLVHFEATLHNGCRDHRLRVLFRTAVRSTASHADMHYTVVPREHADHTTEHFPIERPSPVHAMHRFVTIHDATRAMTLFSDGLPEYEWRPTDATLALTLLRCVGRLSGSDLATRPGGDAGWKNDTPGAQCPGDHRFRFAVLAHAPAAWAQIQLQAEQYHTPLLAQARKDRTRGTAGVCSVDNPCIALSAFMPGVKNDGTTVVRLYNVTGVAAACVVRVGTDVQRAWRARMDETRGPRLPKEGRSIPLEFRPHEIITLLLR